MTTPGHDGASDGKGHWPPLGVLCVDDHHDCADSTAMLLKAMGFDARACYDGRSALVLNDSFHPGICFVDLNMPGMDGDEVAILMRTKTDWHPLLLVAMTAMSNEASSRRIRAAGFDMHLVKPVDPVKIVEAVSLLFRVAELARRVTSNAIEHSK